MDADLLHAAPQTLISFDEFDLGSRCSRGPRPFQHASALPPARSKQIRASGQPARTQQQKQQRARARQSPYSARFEQRAYTRKRFESDFLRAPQEIFQRAQRSFDRNRDVLVTPLPAVLTGRVLLGSAGGGGGEAATSGRGSGAGSRGVFGGASVSRMGHASSSVRANSNTSPNPNSSSSPITLVLVPGSRRSRILLVVEKS